jgi:hypothetical protein
MLQQLGVANSPSSAYHPEYQVALERFHQTLKSMLRVYCFEFDMLVKGVPVVLFAVQDAGQESLSFSPYEHMLDIMSGVL